ncbi:MAG: hypothetical protein FWH23_06215 [Bacteroidales bacterium]|nr:hypothetical protein [Bacteroidales bacterium]
MNLAKIHHEAHCLIAATYRSTEIPASGSVIVSVDEGEYKVQFEKKLTGWHIPVNGTELFDK